MISAEARGTRFDYGCRYGPTGIERPEPAAMQGVFEAEPEDSIGGFRESSPIFASRLSGKRSLGECYEHVRNYCHRICPHRYRLSSLALPFCSHFTISPHRARPEPDPLDKLG